MIRHLIYKIPGLPIRTLCDDVKAGRSSGEGTWDAREVTCLVCAQEMFRRNPANALRVAASLPIALTS